MSILFVLAAFAAFFYAWLLGNLASMGEHVKMTTAVSILGFLAVISVAYAEQYKSQKCVERGGIYHRHYNNGTCSEDM